MSYPKWLSPSAIVEKVPARAFSGVASDLLALWNCQHPEATREERQWASRQADEAALLEEMTYRGGNDRP